MDRNTALSEIKFPTRVKRAIERANELHNNKYKTAGDLMDAKDEDFADVHFFGTGTLRAMREVLNGNQANIDTARQTRTETRNVQAQTEQPMEMVAAQDRGGFDPINWARNHISLIGAIARGEVDLVPKK